MTPEASFPDHKTSRRDQMSAGRHLTRDSWTSCPSSSPRWCWEEERGVRRFRDRGSPDPLRHIHRLPDRQPLTSRACGRRLTAPTQWLEAVLDVRPSWLRPWRSPARAGGRNHGRDTWGPSRPWVHGARPSGAHNRCIVAAHRRESGTALPSSGARLGDVDRQIATINTVAVEGRDSGLGGFRVGHLDETEAAGAAAFALGDDLSLGHLAVLAE